MGQNIIDHDSCGIGACINIDGHKSRDIVENALNIVENLEHRAGKDAEGKTGDGVGILTQIPHKFLLEITEGTEIKLSKEERSYGVGMFFLSQHKSEQKQTKKLFEYIVSKEGLKFLGWREVPVNKAILGDKALSCMPKIEQAFIEKPKEIMPGIDFDRKLYIVRRLFEQSETASYISSLSSRTLIYKGMFLVDQLRSFYLDLQDERYVSAIAMVHSRFSTNTIPSWERAHPYRYIVHNGEINTIKGNADKMLAREETMASESLKKDLHKVLPVISSEGSDSAMFDNTLEFFLMNGIELPLACTVMMPEPWSKNGTLSKGVRDFYQYYSTMMEPWDGPACIYYSDGDILGAVLDRNGLRPSRYYITKNGQVILSSEVGATPIPEEDIIKKDRLYPGKMFLIDTVLGKIIEDKELKENYSKECPYGEWLDLNIVNLKNIKIPNIRNEEYTETELLRLQTNYGYTYEEIMKSILPMALNGREAIASMGNDTPLPVLSNRYQPLFNYFNQIFAQVTNPPIDSIREEIVTSTAAYLGTDGNLLVQNPDNCKILKIHNPILTNTDLLKIKNMNIQGFKVANISLLYYKNASLEKAIERLFVEVDNAFDAGANFLILTDKGISDNTVAIPSLLAVSAVQKHLVRTKKRTRTSLILETGEARDVHHFATLLGYGASAINPYLAQETIRMLYRNNILNKDYYAAVDDYNKAILSGVMKIASKMGISTIQSYLGAQIFEAVGINNAVIDKYFTNTTSRIGGLTLDDIQSQVNDIHKKAFDPLALDTDLSLKSYGKFNLRSGEEEHLYNPKTIHTLQTATRNEDYNLFKEYSKMINETDTPGTLRSLLDFDYPKKGIPLIEVEATSSILKRFQTGAMSYGSLSVEAHEALAIAMNKIGGKSNTGEGGELKERFSISADGLNKNSAVKQVASGRFGVTSSYLISAQEIQIKMAQGAKPGEGGHIPGEKVYPWVAKTRHSTPGVGLISPPPHHDIYSIEDLAELIYDLKCANQKARISVKLTSEAGIGTIACGVAKAGAGLILVSGYDGGTGAAPRSSITNAGMPWELGLSEVHNSLIKSNLRSKVRLETDGKLMTGKDVAIAAVLGAEEFGFATAPLVVLGCVMMRVCSLNTCPTGIATQDPELRKNFKGKPEYIITFMKFIAEELREIMASLGIKTLDELVGKNNLLKLKGNLPDKYQKLDMSSILNPDESIENNKIFNHKDLYDFKLNDALDKKILLKKFRFEDSPVPMSIDLDIHNTDRAFGTILGSKLTEKYQESLDDDTFNINCTGSGGQSLGAFIPKGLSISVKGDSNDYFGKGLSGGILSISPSEKSNLVEDENIIIGNVALYGATSGKAFINGIAGERFCVRNSGALAVVEGLGDHGCEYMTGGRVVVIGAIGKNFAAGMSGGIAYVLDENNSLYTKLNKNMISFSSVTAKHDVTELKGLIKEHVLRTASTKGEMILDNFEEYLPSFKKIIPDDYDKMLKAISNLESKGLSFEESQIEAFYELERRQKNG
ncbi:MAG: glutamate synthase large subunit [Peptostreptococcaceae bacterium]|nr:glutamate synthase large subunit [Peptostreptococcaceae bacterium]